MKYLNSIGLFSLATATYADNFNPLIKGHAYCPDSASICNKKIPTFREYHVNLI